MDWAQVATEALTIAAAVAGNRHLRKRDIQSGLVKSKASREKLESARKDFETEQVSLLLSESNIMRRVMAELKDRMGSVEKSSGHLTAQMHSLEGRIDAANELYQNVLKRAQERRAEQQSEVIETPGGNRLVRNKKKESP